MCSPVSLLPCNSIQRQLVGDCRGPSGVEGRAGFAAVMAVMAVRAEQAAGKGSILGQMPKKHASGPKGPFDSMAVMYGLKPVPFKAMSCNAMSFRAMSCKAMSFSAACEALIYRPCPYKAASFSVRPATAGARGEGAFERRCKQIIASTPKRSILHAH